MAPYVGRVAVGTDDVEFVISIDDPDAEEWSAELGDVSSIPGATAGVFMVRLLDGPREGQKAAASLEVVLPSGITHLVGGSPFANPAT